MKYNRPDQTLKQRLIEVVDQLPQPMLLLNSAQLIVHANREANRVLAEDRDGIDGEPLRGPIGKFVYQGLSALLAALVGSEGRSVPVVLRSGGSLLTASMCVSSRAAWNSEHRAIAIEQLSPERSLPDERLRFALDQVSEGVLIADDNDRIVFANDVATRLLRATPETVMNERLTPLLFGPQRLDTLTDVRDELNDEGRWAGTAIPPSRNGDGVELSVTVTQCSSRSPERKGTRSPTLFRVARLTDATELQRKSESLRAQAERDQLTGVLNRAGFLRAFDGIFAEAQRTGEDLVLVYIDLDRFKYLNDHYGHRYGDSLLTAFARRLTSGVKQTDTVARLGGDEFVVLFGEAPSDTVVFHQVDRLRRKVLQPYQLIDIEYQCGASFGSARYPRDAKSVDGLLNAADSAMFRAKARGKNCYAAYDENEAAARQNEEALVEEVVRATADTSFVPYYPPHFDVRTGMLAGAEALVRWEDVKGNVFKIPGEFLPLVAEHPVLVSLGIHLANQVFAQIDRLFIHQGPFTVYINLSPIQLRAEDTVKHFEQLARQHPDKVGYVALEVTETSFFERDPIVLRNMARIERAGYHFVLDDFGTGHSSIFSLRAHRFTLIKIDKSFMLATTAADVKDKILLESMISLVRGLGLPVLCEGIEEPSHLQLARQLGCDYVQGFHCARPMSRDDFGAYLAQLDGRALKFPR